MCPLSSHSPFIAMLASLATGDLIQEPSPSAPPISTIVFSEQDSRASSHAIWPMSCSTPSPTICDASMVPGRCASYTTATTQRRAAPQSPVPSLRPSPIRTLPTCAMRRIPTSASILHAASTRLSCVTSAVCTTPIIPLPH